MWTDLVAAAADSPILLAILVIGGFAVWAIERLADVNGPITRIARAWQERELRKLRREARLDAERRRARADRDEYVATLEEEVDRLRAQLHALRPSGSVRTAPPGPATEPIEGRHRRNSTRRPLPPR